MNRSMEHITSRENPLVKRIRALSQDSAAYRKLGQVWLEGDHLCRALLERGHQPDVAVFADSIEAQVLGWGLQETVRRVLLPDALLQQSSGLESAARMGFIWSPPATAGIQAGVATVVLDRLQDPGNVGSILRSAGAFGFRQVLAIKGTAGFWSPKVLRAGMGAHFGLHLVEGVNPDDLTGLGVPMLATSSHQGGYLHQTGLPWPCAWLLGHEGQGVSDALLSQAAQQVRIAQPGGEESLNVAAAAAICLHASAVGRPE